MDCSADDLAITHNTKLNNWRKARLKLDTFHHKGYNITTGKSSTATLTEKAQNQSKKNVVQKAPYWE